MTIRHRYGRHSDGIYRSCSRCGKALEDPASRECGVGPICRRKTNDLVAHQIPANLGVASSLFLSLDAGSFNEATEGFDSIRKKFMRKIERLSRNAADTSAIRVAGQDFREVVDWIDYALSFRISRDTRERLIKIVEALGYVGLGGVLRGDACMSPAQLRLEGNTIQLTGKACKAGWLAMKRNIPGVRTPRYRGDRTPYTASVKHAEKFVELALRHWPFIEGGVKDTEELLKLAKEIADNLPKEEVAASNLPTARISRQGNGWFTAHTPWHGTRQEMNDMLAKFKELPRGERKYNPSIHAWSFKTCHYEHVLDIVKQRYNVRD